MNGINLKRYLVSGIVVSLMPILIVGQLVRIQVDSDSKEKLKALQEIYTGQLVTIVPERGIIMDRNGHMVNEKMDEVLKKTKSVSTLNVAILTALNIADDLLKEKEKRIALLREVEVRSKDLVEKIDIKMGGMELEKSPITG